MSIAVLRNTSMHRNLTMSMDLQKKTESRDWTHNLQHTSSHLHLPPEADHKYIPIPPGAENWGVRWDHNNVMLCNGSLWKRC